MRGPTFREPALSEAEGSKPSAARQSRASKQIWIRHGAPDRPKKKSARRPLNLPLASGRVSVLSRSPAFLFLTSNLRVIAAVAVQLKAVFGRVPQYVVFYYLTRPDIRG